MSGVVDQAIALVVETCGSFGRRRRERKKAKRQEKENAGKQLHGDLTGGWWTGMYSANRRKTNENIDNERRAFLRRLRARPGGGSRVAHARLERGALHTENNRGALGARDTPLGSAKRAENVLALGVFEGGNRSARGSGRR